MVQLSWRSKDFPLVCGGMRVSKEDEIAGLDGVEHGMAAYAD